MPTPPSSEVIVIGAGLAGITAAVHLAERGVPVRLLEADALYAGGRLWGGLPSPKASISPAEADHVTLTLNGVTKTFYPEHGMHGIWNNYVNLRAMLERFQLAPEILLAEEQEWIHGEDGLILRAEVGSAVYNSILPPPLHYLNMFTRASFLRSLGAHDWAALFAVWRSLLLATALDPFTHNVGLPGQTLDDFLSGWSPRLRHLFLGLARSGLASPAETISLTAFIACLRFYTLLRRDALRFAYFLTDCGTALINPLMTRLEAGTGELLLGITAESLEPIDANGTAGWKVRAHTRLGPRTFFAAQVILAVEAPAAQRLLLASPFTRPLAEALHWPAGVANAVARLWFKAQPNPGSEGGIFTGDFGMDNFFWLHRIRPDYAEWAKVTSGSMLEMHLYRSAAVLAQPEAALLARVIMDVYRAFPEMKGSLIHQTLQRNAATQTNPRVDKPEFWLGVETPWPNVWACGDWVRGTWPALNMERACVSGLEAANGVLRALQKPVFPVAEYPAPEWFAGQLQAGMWAGRALLRQRRAMIKDQNAP